MSEYEYVPTALRERYENDQEQHFETWLEINAEIAEKYCCRIYRDTYDTYAKLVYAMQFPSESNKEDLEASVYKEEGYRPVLLRGVIIDNKLLEDGSRGLCLIGRKDLWDASERELLHVRECASIYYTLVATHIYAGRQYTIGDLAQLRPGRKVVISLTNLEIYPDNEKTVVAQYTDVAEDKDSDYIFCDKVYKIHQSEKEYLTLYNEMADEIIGTEKGSSNTQNNASSDGCYIATAVYGSYDCPEVWTLRRFRDNILKRHYLGRVFVRFYYAVSPTCVKWFGKTKCFRAFWKNRLDKLVVRLQKFGIESGSYIDK